MTVPQVLLWKQVCKELIAMRMLYVADLDSLIAYVMAADTCNRLSALINDLDQLVEVSVQGVYHAHPYFSMLDRAQTRLSMLAKQFGLTPLARASLRMSAMTPDTEAAHETAASYFAGA
jgi:P27 family predicted phage terminase small subunit